MASWLRIVTIPACIRRAPARHYSEAAHRAATNKWQLAGVPKPRSILDDADDDDAPVDLSEDNDVVNGFRPGQPPPHLKRPSAAPTPHEHKAHRDAMRKSFPDGWSPPRKLSRQAMDALRDLHRADPAQFPAPVLADKFKISPEAVRRILRSKWSPSPEKQAWRAIRERKEQHAFVQERSDKEKAETRTLVQLKKHARPSRSSSSSSSQDPDEEGAETGVSPADTFTFR